MASSDAAPASISRWLTASMHIRLRVWRPYVQTLQRPGKVYLAAVHTPSGGRLYASTKPDLTIRCARSRSGRKLSIELLEPLNGLSDELSGALYAVMLIASAYSNLQPSITFDHCVLFAVLTGVPPARGIDGHRQYQGLGPSHGAARSLRCSLSPRDVP